MITYQSVFDSNPGTYAQMIPYTSGFDNRSVTWPMMITYLSEYDRSLGPLVEIIPTCQRLIEVLMHGHGVKLQHTNPSFIIILDPRLRLLPTNLSLREVLVSGLTSLPTNLDLIEILVPGQRSYQPLSPG